MVLEWTGSLLLQRILVFDSLFELISLRIVLSIHSEDFGVVAEVLLVGNPVLEVGPLLEFRVNPVTVNGSHVVVVDSVLDIVEVVMSHGHSLLSQQLLHLVLRTRFPRGEEVVDSIDDFSLILLGFLLVNLSQFLQLHHSLGDVVLLLLGQVSQVGGGRASKDLARWDRGVLWERSTSCQDAERLNRAVLSN